MLRNKEVENSRFSVVPPMLVFGLSLAVVVMLYYPGLSGPFIFDDMPNLSPMGKYPWLDSWSRLAVFVSSSESGPTGRPVSLLSFWLNDYAWPSNPSSFVYTNLMIHLLNGVLVFWFVVKLLERRQGVVRAAWIAGFCSFVWLIHPLNLTAVLFVIQRMTEMSTLFMLCGLIGYLYGRERVIRCGRVGYYYLTLVLVVFGLLAVFSKENGALLLGYILVTEYWFLRPVYADKPKGYALWSAVVLILPLALLGAYIVYSAVFGGAYGIRDYSLGERLLSEARIVVDYLKQLIVPDLGGSGLFHDDFSISRGMMHPPTTLLSIVFLVFLLFVSYWKKSRESLLSFAILWFFVGHLVESTVIPLELYFEHRNYMPILGFIIVAGIWVYRVRGKLQWVVRIGAAVLVILFAFILTNNARLWGALEHEGMLLAMERPHSIRAQEIARESWLLLGRPDEAREHVLKLVELHPDSGMAIIQWLLFDCEYGYLTEDNLERILVILHSSSYASGVIGTMKEIADQANSGSCKELTPDRFSELLDALDKNPNYTSTDFQFVLSYFRGLDFARSGRLDLAIESLDQAYEIKPNVDILLNEVVFLNSAGLYGEALARVQKVKAENRGGEISVVVEARREELDRLEAALLAKIEQEGERATE